MRWDTCSKTYSGIVTTILDTADRSKTIPTHIDIYIHTYIHRELRQIINSQKLSTYIHSTMVDSRQRKLASSGTDFYLIPDLELFAFPLFHFSTFPPFRYFKLVTSFEKRVGFKGMGVTPLPPTTNEQQVWMEVEEEQKP